MFDYATTDLSLAIVHHLLVFLLAAILAFEIGVIQPSIKREDVVRVARVDLWYGIIAGAIIVVGFSRVFFAAKGWAYYSVNLFFWAKMAAFVAVALISIAPTIQFIRWRQAQAKSAEFAPAAADILAVRRLLWAEAAVFALIPAFAAAMARGYGSLAH
jgi:putative membrane protein